MLSLQVCFWVFLDSCLSPLYSYWAFSFIWEIFLNTEPQRITKPSSSNTQSRIDSGLKESPSLGQQLLVTSSKYNCKGKAPSSCHDHLWSVPAPLKPSVCLSLLQLCLQRALGLCLEANRSHPSQKITKTRVCSHLLHTEQWPREKDAKIKLFLVRPTKKRPRASDKPRAVTVFRDGMWSAAHQSLCTRAQLSKFWFIMQ